MNACWPAATIAGRTAAGMPGGTGTMAPRASQATKPASSTTPAPRKPIVVRLSQPWSSALMMPQTMQNSAEERAAPPIPSKAAPAVSPRDSAMTRSPTSSAIAPMPRLM